MIWKVHRVPRWRSPLLGASLAALALLGFITIAELTGARPPAGLEVSSTPLHQSDGALHLAGTGTWLPLARAWGSAFEKAHPGDPVVVHDSIGSGGGMRAIRDGATDLALLSSPEGSLRRDPCCQVIPIVTGAVVFAVNPSVTLDEITTEQVVAIFEGRMTQWPDGEALVPLLRERGDSATRVAVRQIPRLGPAMEAAREHGRWPLFLTDADMARALEDTPGSIGLHDLGALRLEHPRLRALALDGLQPGIETLSDHSYPLRRTLAVAVPRRARPRAQALLEFIRSSVGREVILRTSGYVPAGREGR